MTLNLSLLSVIVPVFNEEDNLPELTRRLSDVFSRLPFQQYEVLLVSDGSTDSSNQIIAHLVDSNPIYRGALLTRNFGHQAAVSLGLEHAQGSVLCIIDSDLQDPPEAIPDLILALEQGAQVAYGVRTKRKENLLKRAAYFAFYRFLKSVSSIDIPLDSGDFCCMTRPVADQILRLPERNRFLRGLRAWVGYKQVPVHYERAPRFAGQPKYSFLKLAALAYDGVFSFSSLPVKLMQFLGFVTSSAALLTASIYLAWYFFAPTRFPAGWATLIISLWFLGGIQLFFMGLLGEYVFRTFDEARSRPNALVAQTLSHNAEQQTNQQPCAIPTPKITTNSTTAIGGGEHAKKSSWTRSAA